MGHDVPILTSHFRGHLDHAKRPARWHGRDRPRARMPDLGIDWRALFLASRDLTHPVQQRAGGGKNIWPVQSKTPIMIDRVGTIDRTVTGIDYIFLGSAVATTRAE